MYSESKNYLVHLFFLHGTASKQINKTQAHLCHYVNLRSFYTEISRFHTNEFCTLFHSVVKMYFTVLNKTKTCCKYANHFKHGMKTAT